MEADELWKSLCDSHSPWKTLRVSHSSHSADDDESELGVCRIRARTLLTVLLAEQERIETEKAKVYRLYVEDRITPEGFGELYRPLEVRLRQLNEEAPRLQAEIDFLAIRNLSSEEVAREAFDLYSRWQDLPLDERRSIVETIVDRITVGKDEVEIDLAYLPSPSEMMAEGCRTGTSTATPWRS